MGHSQLERDVAELPGVDEQVILAGVHPPDIAAVVRPLSGLYQRTSASNREDLRIDVDGVDPQSVASGVIAQALNSRLSWIAKLAPGAADTWTGTIGFKEGNLGSFPYTNIKIQVVRSGSLAPQTAIVIFSGGGAPNVERTYDYKSPFFRVVDFEFDSAVGVTAVQKIGTHNHPNRPDNLPNETLTIPRVFERAGFKVTTSPGGRVPLIGAGANARWSDMEMHDAMQTHWSRFANRPEWALWVFTASLHEEGTSLGGIMFDDIGPNHRQGTACFNDSFIKDPPASDPAPAAWVERMKFWCTCHEMGHAFNLAHSWQKALGTPWMPLANQPEARSFMNYPHNVAGGPTAFFKNFYYRFSNDELFFMRHAPERFVQMGNANWFDHHAFRQAEVLAEPNFGLELRGHRDKPFEFLEPVVLELKLTNISFQPQLVDKKVLAAGEHLTVIVKKRGQPARQSIPFARRCWQRQLQALSPGDSLYDSLFVSVGQGGWDIAEPGYYTVQVALHLANEDVVSNPISVRVLPPAGREEEVLAQDFFSEDVGRLLTFDGSRVLDAANATVQEVTDQLPDRSVSIHTRIAQANAAMEDYKAVELSGNEKPGRIEVKAGNTALAEKLLKEVKAKPEEALLSLGHIDFNYYMQRFSKKLADKGEMRTASDLLDLTCKLIEPLNPPKEVLTQLNQQQAVVGKGSPASAAAVKKSRA